MSDIPLVYGGSTQLIREEPQRRKKKKFSLSTGAIWTIAIVIIIIAIILTIFLMSRQTTREVIEIPAGEDIPNLDNLINLDPSGLCCQPPAVATLTPRWIYLPSTDVTYSIDDLAPNIVCQNEIGSNLDACLETYTNENGNAKIVAHKGIVPYYGFSIGQAGNICQAFLPCP